MMSGFMYLYVGGILTLVLGLDKLAPLLYSEEGVDSFAHIPFGSQMWFVAGVSLLLVTFHASIVGLVYGRHSRIMRWMRDVP
jgi:hypothetical protein